MTDVSPTDPPLPPGTPSEVVERATRPPRTPSSDPRCNVDVALETTGTPPHRIVSIGDSLTHGFQSGAVFNTALSYTAILAHELGWLPRYRCPSYAGPHGGLPVNLEFLLRDLADRYGPSFEVWEVPLALLRIRSFMDEVEDYWERGPGAQAPDVTAINHCLAVYGWALDDALHRTAASCAASIGAPSNDLVTQVVENDSARAALRVYPHWDTTTSNLTFFGAAQALGDDHDDASESGIETLVVFLGANNVLPAVTGLRVAWADDAAGPRTVWTPAEFVAEYDEIVEAVRAIKARHVIWCTVPHVTVAPIAHGVGDKIATGSRYFPYYTRPWIDDSAFSPDRDRYITAGEARALDTAVDMYNEHIEAMVARERSGDHGEQRDWYLLDIAGLLDRLAQRRYIDDVNARPSWWTAYTLPPALRALTPPPDSRFLTEDGQGGRAAGGLFSLDGVHPTTVGYGLIAQEIASIMQMAGVAFFTENGTPRTGPIAVDFDRLIAHDTLLHPPQNISSAMKLIGLADGTAGILSRSLAF